VEGVAVGNDHAGPPLARLEMHDGVTKEHVVACENSDDTDAVVADTGVAFDGYCNYHIQDVADILAVADDILADLDKVVADDDTDDTFGVVAGIDVGDVPPRL
jgi:hypothetical protein